MKHFAQMILALRQVALTTFIFVLLVGCASTAVNSDEPPEKEPAPIVESTIQQEEDSIVALYQAPDPSGTASATNSRTKTGGGSVAKQESLPNAPETVPTSTDLTNEKVSETSAAEDQPRRTSMPTRDQKKKTPARVGGVRKSVAIDAAASELFGKWRVDQEKSNAGFLRADAILFLADGRMRIWREKGVEDGRWSWNKSDGLKTGGLDGVPFSLGAFEIVNGTVVITSTDDKVVVLIPDRIFIAPPRVLNPPNNSEKVPEQTP